MQKRKRFAACLAAALFVIFLTACRLMETGPARQPAAVSNPSSPAAQPAPPQPLAHPPAAFALEVPYLSQEGLLPTGCELISAKMLLQYWGRDVPIERLVEALPTGSLRQGADGALYGPSPDDVFVGDPTSPHGFGCFPPVIERLLQPFLGSGYTVYDTTGTPLPALCSTYLVRGEPVLVWATINMAEMEPGAQWVLEGSGEIFTWPSHEHCLVLTGYTEDAYLLNDPYENNGKIAVPKALLEQRYAELSCRSVAVVQA